MENHENSKKVIGGEGKRVLQLPMGYRFLPSDAQLISCYLIPKNLSHVLPADVITPIDVFNTNPWDLPGDSREKRYFFCKRASKANKYKLVAGSGYWKGTGKQQVIWDTSRIAIGLKTKRTFFHQKPNTSTTTTINDRWVMWEFRLATSIKTLNSNNRDAIEEVGDWMVCAIVNEKKNPIDNNETRRIQHRRNAIDMENVGDGDVIDHCDHHLVPKSESCYKRYRHNNNNNKNMVIIMKNCETRMPPQEPSTSSSSSTMTLTTDEDFSSREEATSTCLH